MKNLLKLLAVCTLVFSGVAYAELSAVAAADLAERQSAELSAFKEQISTLRGTALIASADLLAGSGLDDPDLYAVVDTKLNALYAEHMADPKNDQVAEELNAVMRALGSMGPKALSTVRHLLETSKSRGIRERALRLQDKLGWFESRNKIMQKPDFYAPSQDLMAHRFANLVLSEDPRNGRWAAEEIERRNGTDKLVFQKMAEVLEKQYLDIKSDIHLDALAWYCKTLSRYSSLESRDLLLKIKQDPAANPKLKKYVRI